MLFRSPVRGLAAILIAAFAGQSLAAGPEISAHCQSLLQAARRSGGFEVQILRAEVNGFPKTIVIVGEQHWDNSREVGALGLKIADLFPFKILERAKLSDLWGGLYFKIVSFRAMKASLKNGYTISTIRTVRKQDGCFDLEEGYTWTLRQQLASLALPLTDGMLRGGSAICLTSLGYLAYSAIAAHDQLLLAGGSVVGALVGSVGLFILSPMLTEEIAKGRRDQVMAANIDRALTENDDINQLLVMVGNAHLRPVTNLLKEKGYEIVPTDYPK